MSSSSAARREQRTHTRSTPPPVWATRPRPPRPPPAPCPCRYPGRRRASGCAGRPTISRSILVAHRCACAPAVATSVWQASARVGLSAAAAAAAGTASSPKRCGEPPDARRSWPLAGQRLAQRERPRCARRKVLRRHALELGRQRERSGRRPRAAALAHGARAPPALPGCFALARQLLALLLELRQVDAGLSSEPRHGLAELGLGPAGKLPPAIGQRLRLGLDTDPALPMRFACSAELAPHVVGQRITALPRSRACASARAPPVPRRRARAGPRAGPRDPGVVVLERPRDSASSVSPEQLEALDRGVHRPVVTRARGA